jgi:hypothetical protein
MSSDRISPEQLLFLRDCRQRISACAYRGNRVDGKRPGPFQHEGASIMVRNCLRMAEIEGYSGEDTMTVIAFEALKQVEHLLDLVLQHSMGNPRTIFPMRTDEEPGNEGG